MISKASPRRRVRATWRDAVTSPRALFTPPRHSLRSRGEGRPPSAWLRCAMTMQLIFILEQVLNGLLIGVYYLLIALGLSLIFSLGGIVNLAHGAFYAIGAYLAYLLTDRIGFAGSFVVAPMLVGLIGIVVERFLLRRFYRSDPI